MDLLALFRIISGIFKSEEMQETIVEIAKGQGLKDRDVWFLRSGVKYQEEQAKKLCEIVADALEEVRPEMKPQ